MMAARSHAAGGHRRFISGIDVYCDRWCERCRFQSRCRSFRDKERMIRAAEMGRDPEEVLLALEAEDDLEIETDGPPVSERERQEFLASLEDGNTEPSPEEALRIQAAIERRDARQTAHPITREALEYADIARRLNLVLSPMLQDRGDPLALASLETIDRFAFFIAVKTRRAIGGLIPLEEDDCNDDEFVAADSKGCAKLVRLVVKESREAWEHLMHLPWLAADGVPAAMVRRLDDLDAHLAHAFPDAMSFVRVGFDEVEME